MLHRLTAGLFSLLIALASCQSPDNPTQQTEQPAVAQANAQQQPRPKPEFFSIPAELVKKRVFICMDGSADTFHQQHDCPVLLACQSTFRNLTLPRAVEDFDRYNCETCSADLAHIFDEDAVRMETGLGH